MAKLEEEEAGGVQLGVTAEHWLCQGATSLVPSLALLRVARCCPAQAAELLPGKQRFPLGRRGAGSRLSPAQDAVAVAEPTQAAFSALRAARRAGSGQGAREGRAALPGPLSPCQPGVTLATQGQRDERQMFSLTGTYRGAE